LTETTHTLIDDAANLVEDHGCKITAAKLRDCKRKVPDVPLAPRASSENALPERVGDVLDGHDEGLERAARICEGTANALKPEMRHQRDALLIVAKSIRELKRRLPEAPK
jgi:hypothetical protein